MENTTNKHINRRERISGLVYILLFFFAGVIPSTLLLFSESNASDIFARKDGVRLKMERRQNFRKDQAEGAEICGMLEKRIADYSPGVNASYEKNDIQFIINDLRRRYENNKHDRHYLVFRHLGDFYEMWFNDREHLWSLKSNIDFLKSNLEQCELGLGQRKEELKSGR